MEPRELVTHRSQVIQMEESESKTREAHYIRYKHNGDWCSAFVETEGAKGALTTLFEAKGAAYEYRGTVEIPEADGAITVS